MVSERHSELLRYLGKCMEQFGFTPTTFTLTTNKYIQSSVTGVDTRIGLDSTLLTRACLRTMVEMYKGLVSSFSLDVHHVL
jgi:hypothetical protein